MKTLRLSLLCGLALSSQAGLFANGGVQYVPILKIHDYYQTGPATTTEWDSNPWKFEAFIDGTGLDSSYPAGPNTLTAPSGSTAGTLNFIFNSNNEWELGDGYGYATKDLLDAAFANGTYTVTIGGITTTMELTGDLYPNTPQFIFPIGAYNNGVLTLTATEVAADFNFTTNGFLGWQNDDFYRIGLNIDGTNGHDLHFSTETFSGNFLSVNVGANTLLPGYSYDFELEFNRIVEFDSAFAPTFGTDAQGVTAYTTITTLKVEVVPEPSTWALLSFGIGCFGLLVWRRRVAA